MDTGIFNLRKGKLLSEVLGKRVYFGYGALALPLALLAITFYVYIPKFYSDVVGVDLGLITTVIVVARIWDAVIDPMIGNLSDRTNSSLGRRRPWILYGSLPLAIFFFLLLYPALCPLGYELWWFAVTSIVFFLFWTIVSVPYEALGAEISFNFHERTRLLSFREGALVLGTLFAGVFPAVLEIKSLGLSADQRFFLLGLSYAIVLVIVAVVCVRAVEERSWAVEKKPTQGVFISAKQALENKPFRILLIAYTIGAFGAGLPAILILYYVEHVLGSDKGSLFLCLYFLVGFICLPAWVKLSRKIGKKEAWVIAMVVNTAAFAGVYFLGAGDEFWYGLLVSLSAVGYGATLALPSSMQADVIDYDEMLHGTRREGQFVGFWAISKKMAAAVGGGIALWILDATGYTPNVEQSETTVWALRVMYAGVPCICNAIAIAIAWQYPIDQSRYEEIRAAIK